MSEKAVQTALQAFLKAMPEFQDDSVTICDWSVLDGPVIYAPYAVIEPANEFEVRWETSEPQSTWNEVVNIYVPFFDWGESRAALRDLRDAIISRLNDPDAVLGLAVRSVRSGSPIGEVYNGYIPEDQRPDALPIFLTQALLVLCEEF
jgi:hypothetical protein